MFCDVTVTATLAAAAGSFTSCLSIIFACGTFGEISLQIYCTDLNKISVCRVTLKPFSPLPQNGAVSRESLVV